MIPALERAKGGVGLVPAPPSLRTAAGLVALGVNVLPLEPRGKRPAVKSWKLLQQSRLFDRDWDEVDRWLCKYWDGPDHNLGAVTGAVSGIAVVDLDDEAARAFVERTCGWPHTVTVRTANGWHLWFQHPGGDFANRVKLEGVGLDVRADGGYVVVPPSVHPSGHVYTWDVSPWDFGGGMWPPAEIPAALAEVLWPKPTPPRLKRFPRLAQHGGGYAVAGLRNEVAAVAAAREGTRNDRLNNAALALGRFVRSGDLERSLVEAELLAAAEAAGLDERESKATIKSGIEAA